MKPPNDSPLPPGVFPPTAGELIPTIDENSDMLIKEFYEHFEEVRAVSPDITQRQAYEGWMIQKVSSLQVLMLRFNERLNVIAAHTMKGR